MEQLEQRDGEVVHVTDPAAIPPAAITAAADAPAIDTNGNGGAPKTLGMVLDRAAFLAQAQKSRPMVRVDLPWIGDGAHVFVRGLSANARDSFDERAYYVGTDKKLHTHAVGLRALLIMLTACDDKGARLFTETDLPALQEMDARTADAIYAPAAEASGLTQKDVDELVRNSARARSDVQS